jgi:hypothetical protein
MEGQIPADAPKRQAKQQPEARAAQTRHPPLDPFEAI